MKRMNLNFTIRIGLITGLLFLGINFSQAQKTLSLENITPLEPILINDVVDFQVVIGVVDGLSMPTSVTGDIYYWFLTDSMILSGAQARILEQDFVSELVSDGFVDVVPIDIQPDEWRTQPANLIILWPAMLDSSVADTHSLSLYVLPDGFLNTPPNYTNTQRNQLFPSPVIQLVYIKPEELKQIQKILFYGMDGSVKATYEYGEFSNGCINLDTFPAGTYLTELYYFDNRVIRTKIQKR